MNAFTEGYWAFFFGEWKCPYDHLENSEQHYIFTDWNAGWATASTDNFNLDLYDDIKRGFDHLIGVL